MLVKHSYYSSGELYATYQTNEEGRPCGLMTRYFLNGEVKDLTMYRNGVFDGKTTVYYENPRYTKLVRFFVSGKSFGELVHYDCKGGIIKHILIDENENEVPLSQYVQDIYNLTPEEEVTLALAFGDCIIYPRPNRLQGFPWTSVYKFGLISMTS